MAPAEPCSSGWPRLLVNLGERSESEAVCRVPLLAGPAVRDSESEAASYSLLGGQWLPPSRALADNDTLTKGYVLAGVSTAGASTGDVAAEGTSASAITGARGSALRFAISCASQRISSGSPLPVTAEML